MLTVLKLGCPQKWLRSHRRAATFGAERLDAAKVPVANVNLALPSGVAHRHVLALSVLVPREATVILWVGIPNGAYVYSLN